jgi:hypothetical protein
MMTVCLALNSGSGLFAAPMMNLMGFQISGMKNRVNKPNRKPSRIRKLADAPTVAAIGRGRASKRHNFQTLFLTDRPRTSATFLVNKPINPAFGKSFAPFQATIDAQSDTFGDFRQNHPLRGGEHNSGSHGDALLGRASGSQHFQLGRLLFRQFNLLGWCSHLSPPEMYLVKSIS